MKKPEVLQEIQEDVRHPKIMVFCACALAALLFISFMFLYPFVPGLSNSMNLPQLQWPGNLSGHASVPGILSDHAQTQPGA